MPNRKTAVALHLEVHARDWHKAAVEEWQPLRAIVERSVDAIQAAQNSGRYTTQGKTEKVRELQAQALDAIKPFRDKVAAYDRRITDVMAAAVPQTTRERDTIAGLFRENREIEIRNRLMAEGADPVAIATRYYDAISRGDWEFVSAVENAPQAWPLLNESIRAQGLAMKIERSPRAGELQELRRDRDIAASIVQAAQHDIDEAVGGVRGPIAHRRS
jgi:hypothetical protein